MMSNKYLYIIPLALVEALLQLVFFWLAPDVDCFWVVYTFGTVMSLIHIGLVFVIGATYGARRCMATIVSGSICQAILFTACAVLLTSGANIRDAIFALLIVSIIYAVVVTLLVFSIKSDNITDTFSYVPVNNEKNNCLEDSASHLNNDQIVNLKAGNNIVPPPLPVRK